MHEIMVARNGEQTGLGAERLEMVPDMREGSIQLLELLGLAVLGEVTRKEDEVPGTASLVQLLEVREYDLTYTWPQPTLIVEALVKIREVEPPERVHVPTLRAVPSSR